MHDESDPSSDSSPRKSYRVCDACQCQIHHKQECCPECGAFPGENHPPTANKTINFVLSTVLFLLLGLGLLALSHNREEAVLLEQQKFSRLTHAESPAEQSPPEKPPLSTRPAPSLRPTPTALPFRKDDFIRPTPVPSMPTPVRQTLPPPAPTATVLPLPEPTPNKLEQRDQIALQFLKELDEKYPMAQVGEQIELTFLDNRTLKGRIARMEAHQLALRTQTGIRWITYRQLSRNSRMRVDQSERETWAEEKALQELLKIPQQ